MEYAPSEILCAHLFCRQAVFKFLVPLRNVFGVIFSLGFMFTRHMHRWTLTYAQVYAPCPETTKVLIRLQGFFRNFYLTAVLKKEKRNSGLFKTPNRPHPHRCNCDHPPAPHGDQYPLMFYYHFICFLFLWRPALFMGYSAFVMMHRNCFVVIYLPLVTRRGQ